MPFVTHASRPHEVHPQIKKHFISVRLKDVVPIPNDANPRQLRKDTSPLQKKIHRSAKENDIFSLLSRPPVILVKEVEVVHVDGRNLIRCSLPPGEKYGLGDGQHLHAQIVATQGELADDDPRCLDFVLIEDKGLLDKQRKSEISAALNSGINVKHYSIFDYVGDFDWIKNILANTDWEGYFRFRENDKGKEGIESLMQWLSVLDPNNQDPSSTYNKAVYRDMLQEDPRCFEHFSDILIEILDLVKAIRFDSYKLLAQVGFNGTPAEMAMFAQRAKLNDTLVLMILSAYRGLLTLNGDMLAWKLPKERMREAIEETLPRLLLKVRSRPATERDPRTYARSLANREKARAKARANTEEGKAIRRSFTTNWETLSKEVVSWYKKKL